MAGELVDRLVAPLQRHLHGPGLLPGGRIGERDAVRQRVRSGAGEPLHQVQAVGGAAEVALGGEVLRLDHQRVAVPVAARVAVPLPDLLRQVRPVVERYEPRVVERLVDEGQVGRRLDDLVVGVRSGAEVPAYARYAGGDAAVDVVQVLRTGLVGPAFVHRRLARPGQLGLFRYAPVGRVDDERGAVGERDVHHVDRAGGRLAVVGLQVLHRGPEGAFRRGERAAPVVEYPPGPLLERGDLLVRQMRAVGLGRQAFERGGHVVQPDALQVGTAVGHARRLPRFRRLCERRRRAARGKRQHHRRVRQMSFLHDPHLPSLLRPAPRRLDALATNARE